MSTEKQYNNFHPFIWIALCLAAVGTWCMRQNLFFNIIGVLLYIGAGYFVLQYLKIYFKDFQEKDEDEKETDKSRRKKVRHEAKVEELTAKDDVDSIDDIKKIRQRLRFVELQSKELDNKLKALPLEEFELRKQVELERMRYETEKEKLMRDLRGF
jgi:Tfp pilus assembly protein PilO